ncbi:hypothetical protein ACFWOJ_33795 [Streptomyces sp. NPDC058439]|uniref:hypothetical protein n=1 Tax=Streptomyces sp. NPDC058439 TaxID=3346500 RepID=UPI003660FDEB
MKTATWDFVSTHAEMFGIKRICRVLEVSRSGYRWIAGAEARAGRQFEEDALVEEIRKIHAEHRGNYGATEPCCCTGAWPASTTTGPTPLPHASTGPPPRT